MLRSCVYASNKFYLLTQNYLTGKVKIAQLMKHFLIQNKNNKKLLTKITSETSGCVNLHKNNLMIRKPAKMIL